MSVAVAPKRLGWWFAAEADRPASLHASYVVAAGFLGVLWNLVLFVIPLTKGPFTYPPREATARDQLLTTLALVLTSVAISTLFRRLITRVRPALILVVAPGLLLLGACLFEIAWCHLTVAVEGPPWNSFSHYLRDMLKTAMMAIELTTRGFWVTVPMATLHLIALRAVAQKSIARASMSADRSRATTSPPRSASR